MNILELACIEASKDNFELKQSQWLDRSQIVPADDYLQVSALLNDGKKRLSVVENFVDVMAKHPTFSRTVAGYLHNETGVYYAAGQLTPLANKTLYQTIYALTIRPDPFTVLIFERGTFFINIHKLAHFDGSRQKALIDTLVNCEVFAHKARVANPTAKHKRDSMAVILKRDFKVNSYEWSLTFSGEISVILLAPIQREAVVSIDGCYYLHQGKRVQCKVKAYNASAMAADRKGKPYQYIPGDLMKFEATFQREFFIHHDYATVARFKKQCDSFNLLVSDILRQFSKHLLNKLTATEKRKLFNATGMTNEVEFMSKLTDPNSLQTALDIELLDLKKQLQALAGYLQANTIATEANTVAINANTAVLVAANEASFLKEKTAFVTQQEKQIDQRKLRVVR